MPEKRTLDRARKAESPSSQAGEFVREEIDHVREGKHGARNTKQAIAIGLSKARKAGVKLPPPPGKKAPESSAGHKTNPKRSNATLRALKREGSGAASHEALSEQAHESARTRGSADLHRSAMKAVRTKGPEGRRNAAAKAARTRTSSAA
jgi:Family of unknown function (DUF6496)